VVVGVYLHFRDYDSRVLHRLLGVVGVALNSRTRPHRGPCASSRANARRVVATYFRPIGTNRSISRITGRITIFSSALASDGRWQFGRILWWSHHEILFALLSRLLRLLSARPEISPSLYLPSPRGRSAGASLRRWILLADMSCSGTLSHPLSRSA